MIPDVCVIRIRPQWHDTKVQTFIPVLNLASLDENFGSHVIIVRTPFQFVVPVWWSSVDEGLLPLIFVSKGAKLIIKGAVCFVFLLRFTVRRQSHAAVIVFSFTGDEVLKVLHAKLLLKILLPYLKEVLLVAWELSTVEFSLCVHPLLSLTM